MQYIRPTFINSGSGALHGERQAHQHQQQQRQRGRCARHRRHSHVGGGARELTVTPHNCDSRMLTLLNRAGGRWRCDAEPRHGHS